MWSEMVEKERYGWDFLPPLENIFQKQLEGFDRSVGTTHKRRPETEKKSGKRKKFQT